MEVICFIATEIIKTIIALLTTAVLGIAGWLITLRKRSEVIRQLVGSPNRQFKFYYRGQHDPAENKTITFQANGNINDGTHMNESTWEIAYGTLRIFDKDLVLYSKFKWDKVSGQLIHVNDPTLPSAMGQYMVPLFIKRNSNAKLD